MHHLAKRFALVAIVALASVVSVQGGTRPRDGLIAFARGGGVYVLDPTTGRGRRIADGNVSGLHYFDVSWSPDGRRLAVATEHTLLTMSARGTQVRTVADFQRAIVAGVAWSPHGRELAIYGEFEPHRYEIDLFGLGDHRRRVVVASSEKYFYDVSWSPDARRLVYAEAPPAFGAEDSIHSIRVDGSDHRKIGPGGAPRLSRDGTRIAFNTASTVSVMRADGTGIRVVKRDRRLVSYRVLTWSPDGRSLLLDRVDRRPIPRPRAVSDLLVVSLDGRTARHVGPFFRGSLSAASAAAWAPAR
jgi:Tol biopolymer transport system component